jgi:predicted RNase H-like nuclease (RuvC/YqgF family)
LSFDETLAKPQDPSTSWNSLESRVDRLLENILLLRDINIQLKKENESLKAQLKIINDSGSARELDKLRQQYDEAIQDLRQVKQNLQNIETLANELKLEGY